MDRHTATSIFMDYEVKCSSALDTKQSSCHQLITPSFVFYWLLTMRENCILVPDDLGNTSTLFYCIFIMFIEAMLVSKVVVGDSCSFKHTSTLKLDTLDPV